MAPVKTMVFRCKWVNSESEMDGYTYAVDKKILNREIKRRHMSCGDTVIELKLVPVTIEFSKLIENGSEKFYSTIKNKHQQDLEKD
jgi:hypothetical protein